MSHDPCGTDGARPLRCVSGTRNHGSKRVAYIFEEVADRGWARLEKWNTIRMTTLRGPQTMPHKIGRSLLLLLLDDLTHERDGHVLRAALAHVAREHQVERGRLDLVGKPALVLVRVHELLRLRRETARKITAVIRIGSRAEA
eukprot:6083283-Pleurochrysis_carterae.AAC.3